MNPNLIEELSKNGDEATIQLINNFVVQGYGLWHNQIWFSPRDLPIDEQKSAFSLLMKLEYAKNWVLRSEQLRGNKGVMDYIVIL